MKSIFNMNTGNKILLFLNAYAPALNPHALITNPTDPTHSHKHPYNHSTQPLHQRRLLPNLDILYHKIKDTNITSFGLKKKECNKFPSINKK